MTGKIFKRFIVKGTMAYVAVFALVLMVAMPAVALMANSVGSPEIIDHSIRSADIRNKAVTTDRIAPRAVKRGKIGKRAIRTEHINYISDSKIRYSRKTRVLSISAAALNPTVGGGVYSYNKNVGQIEGQGTFSAPVYLPDRAVVIGFKAELRDISAGQFTDVDLRRWSTTGADTMAAVTTIGSPSSFSWRTFKDTNGISFSTINNTTHAYYAVGYLSGGGVGIGRIIITYRTTRP